MGIRTERKEQGRNEEKGTEKMRLKKKERKKNSINDKLKTD